MKFVLSLTTFLICLISCNNNGSTQLSETTKKDSSSHLKMGAFSEREKSRLEREQKLISLMTNKVELDSLLNKITHQEKIKIIGELKENWDDKDKIYKYSDSDFSFQLKTFGYGFFPDEKEANSILYDGKQKISFDNYKITCYDKSVCVDYGFNIKNTLLNPKVIEVCGLKFLYSNISFSCNGIGCGCVITMIYDLQTKRPTFIENYRFPYDGFFISDFNNDNKPDLLIIEKSNEEMMRGFSETVEFEINLYAYSYSDGKFAPSLNNQFLKPISYKLYGIGEYGDYTNLTCSVVENNWYKQ